MTSRASSDRWYRDRFAHGHEYATFNYQRLPALPDWDWVPLCVLAGVDDRTVDVCEEALEQILRDHATRLIDVYLDPRSRFILRAKFDDDRTYEDIGNELDLTRERVRQIVGETTKRLTGLLR